MRRNVSGTVGSVVVIGDNLAALGAVVLAPVKIKAAVGIPAGACLAEESTGKVKGIARVH